MSAQMHGKCKNVTYKLFSNEINYLKDTKFKRSLSCHNVSYCRHLFRHLLIYILSFFSYVEKYTDIMPSISHVHMIRKIPSYFFRVRYCLLLLLSHVSHVRLCATS